MSGAGRGGHVRVINSDSASDESFLSFVKSLIKYLAIFIWKKEKTRGRRIIVVKRPLGSAPVTVEHRLDCRTVPNCRSH